MSNRLSRDTEEAAKVLAALRDRRHPDETLAERLTEADNLRAKLVNVASGLSKWTVSSQGDDTLITLAGSGSVRVHTDEKTGLIHVGRVDQPLEGAPLVFDPVNHAWFGTDVDTEIEVAPGDRRPRKAALVVLAEQIVTLLESAPSA